MKICPLCRTTYTDPNLNFCLEDGSVLQAYQGGSEPDTVLVNQLRQTQTPQQGAPLAQPQWNVHQQSSQPKKSSKVLVWVLLILGAVVFLCGGGFAGLLLLSSGISTTDGSRDENSTNTSSQTSTTTNTTSTKKVADSPDLSKWVQESKSFGETEFTDGQFIMSSKARGYYYALAATEKYRSVGSDVSVTVTNLNGAPTDLGFGLVFHSEVTPLRKGYAFLIDSVKRRYRIVNHTPSKENVVVNWTSSDAIREGKQPNSLEARDGGPTIDLYINGKKVNSIRNVHGAANGVVGLYAGDGIKVAFRDLEIRR